MTGATRISNPWQYPESPTWHQRRWVQVSGAGAAGLFLGLAISAGGSSTAQDASSQVASLRSQLAIEQQVNERLRSQATTLKQHIDKLTIKPAATAVSGDGTFLVGKEIQPGTYRSTGGQSCYWARLRNTSGSIEAISANHLGPGTAVVTISKTDAAFETARCAAWQKVG